MVDIGLFAMPNHPPERSLGDGHAFDLEVIRWGDELGYQEAWIGEHHIAPWEPHPSPELLIAQAFMVTKNIRIGPGGFLLPFHHPAQIADRAAMLDHISGGRFNLGVAAGQVKGDLRMFRVDAQSGTNRAMVRESLEIIRGLWGTDGPFAYEGKFWSVERPGKYDETHWPHIRPFQQPHMPIGLAGGSPGSEMLKMAGEFGYWPITPEMGVPILQNGWDSVEEGARRSGRTPDRRDWRIIRDVFVAETDAEAERLAMRGATGDAWRRYIMRLYEQHSLTGFLKHDPSIADSDVTIEYCARNLWLMGSPQTVAEKIAALYEAIGGFGVVLAQWYDWADDPGPWRESMRLFAEEVAPRVAELVPPAAVRAT